MSDFNKGDFTQQGVDGHVRATLRLNEKRYVELDLTTNEDARGCTISGNVHDRLNNLDYPIGAAKTISSKTITENGTYNASADDCDGYNPVTVNVPQPSGNIAITENTAEDEPLNIAQYATATVNVPVPAPERHYIVNNEEYTSIVQGGISGITLPGVYFYAPDVTLIIDGVSQTLRGFVDSASTTVRYVSPEDTINLKIIITEDYLGAGIFSGTLIPTTDTEPTPHTITIYYEGEKKYWQIVKVDSNSDAPFSKILNYYFVNDNVTYTGSMITKLVQLQNGAHLDSAIEVYPDGAYIYCVSGLDTSYIISSAYEQNITYGRYSKQNNSNVSSECNLAFLTYKTTVRQEVNYGNLE